MEESKYVSTLAALANDVRLAVFRLLMRAWPEGRPAGEIAAELDIPSSTLSTHLAQLCRAGLLRSTRRQQQIIYAVDVQGARALVSFLTDECCQGHPEICGYGIGSSCSPPARAADKVE